MRDGVVALVCSDSSVAKLVTEAGAQVSGIQVRIVPSFKGHEATLDEAVLVLAALDDEQGADTAAAWLRRVMTSKKPISTVLICDHERNDLALPLLRLGAIDCLNRPIDIGRLVYLIDILT